MLLIPLQVQVLACSLTRLLLLLTTTVTTVLLLDPTPWTHLGSSFVVSKAKEAQPAQLNRIQATLVHQALNHVA